MSGWAVISFETVREQRAFNTTEDEEVKYSNNPNWEHYCSQFENGVTDEDWELPRYRLQRQLVENYPDIYTDFQDSVVYAMTAYNAPFERILDETVELWDMACVIQANDTSDTGIARVYNSVPDSPEEDPVLRFRQVDEYKERQEKGEYRVGDKAAAYVSFNYGFTARSRKPLGKGLDRTIAMNHNTGYRVIIEDPTDTEGEQINIDDRINEYTKTRENKGLQTNIVYYTREAAEKKAEKLEEELDITAYVDEVPIKESWLKGIEREFDPTQYPSYESLRDDTEQPRFPYYGPIR